MQLNSTEIVKTINFLQKTKEIKIKSQNIPTNNPPQNHNTNTEENIPINFHTEKISFKEINIEDIKNHKRELLKKSLNETMMKIKSIDSDITIHSDSPDAYIKDKIIYMPLAGKYTKIIKKFYNLGSSETFEAFKLSSVYYIFNN